MRAALTRHRDAGVTAVICGDIFLEDVRRYREERLFAVRAEGRFPALGRATAASWHGTSSRWDSGRCCAASIRIVLAAGFAGRVYDERFWPTCRRRVDPAARTASFIRSSSTGPTFGPVQHSVGEFAFARAAIRLSQLLLTAGVATAKFRRFVLD